MKLLHTADWHLGARLGRHDRLPDLQVAIEGLLRVVEDEQPDLVIHAGDLFDASRPPYPALELAVAALNRLATVAPTVVLCGNHDSRHLFRVLNRLVGTNSPRRLWFVEVPKILVFDEEQAFDVEAGSPVAIACVPFIPPSAVANYASDDPSTFEGKYADGIRTLNARLLDEARTKANHGNGIVLYAAHLHVHGARPGRSERRLTVGEDYATHTSGLERAMYCAFGHIHDPQPLPGGSRTGRYAGSLVPLDFGELDQQKHCVVVTIEHDVQVTTRNLPTGRPLVQFDGPVEEFLERASNGAFDGCFLKATVQSDTPVPDLADRLIEASQDCCVFEIVPVLPNQSVREISDQTSAGVEPSLQDLFLEWRYNAAKGVKSPHEAVTELFLQAVAGIEQENAPDFGLTDLLLRAEQSRSALRHWQFAASGQKNEVET